MKRVIVVVLLLLIAISCADVDKEDVTDRATKYYTNYFSGAEMDLREWVIDDQENLRYLETFGGLKSAVKSGVEEAQKNGGLSSVNVEVVETKGDDYAVLSVTLRFGNETQDTFKDYWIFVDGKWKNSDEKFFYGNKSP